MLKNIKKDQHTLWVEGFDAICDPNETFTDRVAIFILMPLLSTIFYPIMYFQFRKWERENFVNTL